MKYVRPQDFDYIMNKYHDPQKPFDGHSRFVRRDELFQPETGMDPAAILAGIEENDEKYRTLPHPVRKARGLEYVLQNTRICWDGRDRFPAVNMLDRPLNRVLINKWKEELFAGPLQEVRTQLSRLENCGLATLWPDYDHSVPVWSRIFKLGFAGLLAESEKARENRTLTAEEEGFFDGIKITYEAVLAFVARLSSVAPDEKTEKALNTLHRGAPETFYEALLLSYLYFIISEHIDGLQVRSLSGFDTCFFDFYKKDLAKGVTEEEIRTDLAYYLLQFTAIGNYWNQPVFLGGEKADGTTKINELSHLFLDVYDGMNLYNPKIQIKVSDTTPKDFLEKALDMIRRGRNSVVFVGDHTIRKALMGVGVDADKARECNITGCYEYLPQGSYATAMNYFNLVKPLEFALHRGRDGVNGLFGGLESPPPESFADFEAFFNEYKKQLRHSIEETVKAVDGFEGYLAHINPLSLLSATFPRSLERAKDAIAGGGELNETHLLCGFLADAADSLMMISKYVYEKKELSLPALVRALDRNFEGSETLRLKLLADREKWGNNKDRVDAIAVEIVNFITKTVCGRPNARGGTWNCGFHVARMSYVQGKKTAASANGRRLGEELSKNVSASMGQNREGATAAILSVTKIDATSFTNDASLDLGVLPSAVRGEDGLAALFGLLTTFVKRGGHAIHMNVFDAETLRDAQKNPEKYRDLQIRVCGWNVLWNNICKEEQDGFIRQAEALV